MNFNNKIILITGAASGIGADAAIHFSNLGASVALVDRDSTRLTEIADQIRESGASEPLEIVADVTLDTERIVHETVERFGRINVLVNSAGIGRKNTEPLGSMETYDVVMNVNLRSVLQLSKLAVPHLAKTSGNIVNVSSTFGSVATNAYTAYALSKSAIDHFTRCAAVELAPKGIRVNAIKPGLVRTSIWPSAGFSSQELDDIVERYLRTHPIGRIGKVQDTSNAIAFLAHDASSFITGHLLYVDGGDHLVS